MNTTLIFRRHWYQFSLRTMFAVITVTAGLAALLSQPIFGEFVPSPPIVYKADGKTIDEVRTDGYHELRLEMPIVFCLEMLLLAVWVSWRCCGSAHRSIKWIRQRREWVSELLVHRPHSAPPLFSSNFAPNGLGLFGEPEAVAVWCDTATEADARRLFPEARLWVFGVGLQSVAGTLPPPVR